MIQSRFNILDLFSGIGGFSLGLESTGYFQTTAFCEIEPYCQKVLKKHWPEVPIHSDIRETNFERYRGTIDLITGGYPCQPFSAAGKQRGEEDPRHLWPRMREIIKQVRPTWVICENVYGHVKLGLDKVLLDLENEGYTTRTFIVPACSVNAPHRRDRLWIISYSEHNGSSQTKEQGKDNGNARKGEEGQEQPLELAGIHSSSPMAHPNSSGRREGNKKMEGGTPEQLDSPCVQPGQNDAYTISGSEQGRAKKPFPRLPDIQIQFERSGETVAIVSNTAKPNIRGVTNGFPGRVDRIKALGNSIVPQIAHNIGLAIYATEKKNKTKKV